MGEIEVKNIGSTTRKLGKDSGNRLEYIDPYLYLVQIFNIQTFNTRIMKTKEVLTYISDGPLLEDRLLPPKKFLLNNHHYNKTSEDLSEVWDVSVHQAKITLEATTQHHSRSAIIPSSRGYCMDRIFEPVRLKSQMSTDIIDPRYESLQKDH